MSVETLYSILTLVALVFSALFSGLETVYLSVDRLRLAARAHNRNRYAMMMKKQMDNPGHFLATTLTGNNLANIAYTSFFALLLTTLGYSEKTIIILSPIIILIVGETTPKIIARYNAEFLAPIGALILNIAQFILWVFIKPFEKGVAVLQRWFRLPEVQMGSILSRLDLTAALNYAGQSGALPQRAEILIRRSLQLAERRVFDVMTPRTSVVMVQAKTPLSELRRRFTENQYQRIVVYGDDIDDTLGYVHSRDLLYKDILEDAQLTEDVMRTLPMVPESLPTVKLPAWLRANHTRFAGVIDEYGGFAGVVSVEDLAEELVGPILQESRSAGRGCIRLTDQIWLVDGSVRLSHLASIMNIDFPSVKSSTVAGLLTELAGEDIPDVGSEYEFNKFRLRVISADPRGVKRVRVTLPPTHKT